MGKRTCGCALEQIGWNPHLWKIRSFEKLTSASVTFEASSRIPVLEELLPARFGDGSTDYQLAESEGPGGEPILELIVHPKVGRLVDEGV